MREFNSTHRRILERISLSNIYIRIETVPPAKSGSIPKGGAAKIFFAANHESVVTELRHMSTRTAFLRIFSLENHVERIGMMSAAAETEPKTFQISTTEPKQMASVAAAAAAKIRPKRVRRVTMVAKKSMFFSLEMSDFDT